MECPSFDPFSSFDGFSPSEVGVGGRDVVQALMVALVIIVLDERFDLMFEVSRQDPPYSLLPRDRLYY